MSAWEFAPGWSKPKMTKAQVRKYIQDMEKARELAQKKLEEAEKNKDVKKDQKELSRLEDKLDEIL